MKFASTRERDWHGRFIIPVTPSGFDVKKYRKERYLKNKETILAKCKQWAKKNPIKRAEIRKRWRLKNRELINYYAKLRNYREKNAEGHHTLADIKKIKEAWDNKCAYCREKPAETIDHVEPLTKGGTNDPRNLVAACFSCNSKKGNKNIWAWDFFWAYQMDRINANKDY